VGADNLNTSYRLVEVDVDTTQYETDTSPARLPSTGKRLQDQVARDIISQKAEQL
jgi:hypothetical protein